MRNVLRLYCQDSSPFGKYVQDIDPAYEVITCKYFFSGFPLFFNVYIETHYKLHVYMCTRQTIVICRSR